MTSGSNGCQTLSNTILTLGYRADVRISTYKNVKSIINGMKIYGNKISKCYLNYTFWTSVQRGNRTNFWCQPFLLTLEMYFVESGERQKWRF